MMDKKVCEAVHAERLWKGYAELVWAAVAELLLEASAEPAPPGVAYVLHDGSSGCGVGLSWREARRTALVWYVKTLLDPELAADAFNEIPEDPAAYLRGELATWAAVVVQVEDPRVLVRAVSALVEGHTDLMRSFRLSLAERAAR